MRRGTELKAVKPFAGHVLEFVKAPQLYKFLQAGRGSGKTVAGVFEVRRYVKRWPGALFLCTEPTFPMVRDILKREFDRQFAEAGETSQVEWSASKVQYTLANGSEIWLKQCYEPETLRGPTIAGAWMDEAAQCPRLAYELITPALRQRGYPHIFMFTGTPRGQNWLHWVFSPGNRPDGAPEYIGAVEGLENEVARFQASSYDNPHLDPVTRAMLLAPYPRGTKGYEQEVEGRVTSWEGLVYPQFSFDEHVRELPRELQVVRTVGGLDWGWENPGVAVVLLLLANGEMWVVDEVYETHRGIKDWWAPELKRLQGPWGPMDWYADPSQPANIAELVSEGLRCDKAENAVIPGITALGSAIAAGKFYVTPNCRETIREFGLYQWKQTKAGETRPDDPEKVNDHGMDASRYACMALQSPQQRVTQVRIVERPKLWR